MSDYLAGFLKDNDRDRYFASLMLPERHRPAFQALFAFNVDVASIPERSREPTAGEIRLQWWSDALSGAGHGDVRQHPIAAALLDATARYQLPAGALVRLLAARRFDLYADPMPDRASFEGYAGETVSVLYQFAAMLLNQGRELEGGDAAGHLGVAVALVGHLRAFGYNASRGRIFLPWDIFVANGVTEPEVLGGTDSEGLRAALAQVADLAREHLAEAAAAIAALPAALRPAFAEISLLPAKLRALERVASPFTVDGDIGDWRKLALLSWWTWRNGG